MKIIIAYEASWRNSFLDGDNNSPLPKQGRKFIASMTELKKTAHYRKREITRNTVMGVLNRLIGDQRKLYQSRQDEAYYFKDIENRISHIDKPKVINNEMIYIRNITGNTDQNAYTGMIKTDDAIFHSDYSKAFWGVLALDLAELCQFIESEQYPVTAKIVAEPLSIIAKLEELRKLKPLAKTKESAAAYNILKKHFPKLKGLNNKGLIKPISLYCSALYLQLSRLESKYDMSTAKAPRGGISGISHNDFTKRDFMDKYTTGEKKKIWGNPYITETLIKGEGRLQKRMIKASGKLEITLDIERDRGKAITKMIENAGVSSFYLGKKGLAYVEKICI